MTLRIGKSPKQQINCSVWSMGSENTLASNEIHIRGEMIGCRREKFTNNHEETELSNSYTFATTLE